MADWHGEVLYSGAFMCPPPDAGSHGEQPWHTLWKAGLERVCSATIVVSLWDLKLLFEGDIVAKPLFCFLMIRIEVLGSPPEGGGGGQEADMNRDPKWYETCSGNRLDSDHVV